MATPSQHDLRNDFRALLASGQCYYTASTFDPMSARIAADLGFEVGILGGSVASLQVLAAPDFALITLSEFTEQATRIGRVARYPSLPMRIMDTEMPSMSCAPLLNLNEQA